METGMRLQVPEGKEFPSDTHTALNLQSVPEPLFAY